MGNTTIDSKLGKCIFRFSQGRKLNIKNQTNSIFRKLIAFLVLCTLFNCAAHFDRYIETQDAADAQKAIFQGANVNERDVRYGRTPLMWAAAYGDGDIVRLLIEKGADVNVRDNTGETALLEAVKYGKKAVMFDEINIVELLIANRADINARDNEGKTALIEAVRNAPIQTIKLLIEKGADVNLKAKNGFTAFVNASMHGKIEMADLLLPSVVGTDSMTRYWIAYNQARKKVQSQVNKMIDKMAMQKDAQEKLHLGFYLDSASLAALDWADFSGKGLDGAHLEKANLRNANFQDASLRNANLQGADLRDANLRGVDLRNAHLQGADLRDADFGMFVQTEVKTKTITVPAHDTIVTYNPHVDSRDPHYVLLPPDNATYIVESNGNITFNFPVPGTSQDVEIPYTETHEVNLEGVDLRNANLEGARLGQADLSKVGSLYEARLDSAMLSKVKTSFPEKLAAMWDNERKAWVINVTSLRQIKEADWSKQHQEKESR